MKRCPDCHRLENDDALKFCRVDGATLVDESSPLNSEAGTAPLGSASLPAELETSILPHATDAVVNRATGPTTALPLRTAPTTTGRLKTASTQKILIAIPVLIVIAVAIAGFVYVSRRNKNAIS